MTGRREGIAGRENSVNTMMQTGGVEGRRYKGSGKEETGLMGVKCEQGKVLGSQRGQSLARDPVA